MLMHLIDNSNNETEHFLQTDADEPFSDSTNLNTSQYSYAFLYMHTAMQWLK